MLDEPSALVTVTTKVFSPVTRPESPVMSKLAFGSSVTTSTSTSVVPGARSTVSPSTTSEPFTVKDARSVIEPSGTTKVTVYS